MFFSRNSSVLLRASSFVRSNLCILTGDKATALYHLALAINLGLLKAVAPLRAALAHMDMIQRIAG